MSDGARRRYWNPAGIAFASVFLSMAALFGVALAAALGWIEPPGGARDGAMPFGPVGAGFVAAVFAYLGLRCNLWIDVDEREVVVRGVVRARRLPRDPRLETAHDFRTRPPGLRLTSGGVSVLAYPRPKGSEDLLRVLGRERRDRTP